MIMKTCLQLLFAIISGMLLWSCSPAPIQKTPAQLVNPFIGTGGHGHTYPGATVPFGMVQLSPQTRLDGWDGCSGYHYSDSVIYGFAHTALSGTGVSDYGDVLMMPVVGKPVFDPNQSSSEFSKADELASAGYYCVKLLKPGVKAELTAGTRVGYHRYTFPESHDANIIIDLKHRDQVVDAWIEFVSDTEIRGMRRSTNWAKDMLWFFHMKFSKPFNRKGIALNDTLAAGQIRGQGKNVKAFVGFDTQEGEAIEVKVALSAVDAEGALRNLETEAPGLDFAQAKTAAENLWNKSLSVIQAEGGTEDQRTVFYTALYHTMLQPNVFMDADGRFRGMNREIDTAENFTNYTVFSLWDTYRAWHPLMTIIDQKRTNDYIQTMLHMHQKTGVLPVWELAGNETWCMIGNHAIPVITDAWIKGIRGFDGNKALEAMIQSTGKQHFGLEYFRNHGYLPGDVEHESVSKTLEYGYDDWCIATMAADIQQTEIAADRFKTAQAYKNLFDPSTGFMRPRINGGWLTPFDPTTVDWHFTEANSWQYSFYVPHDISGLADLHGGKKALAGQIDKLFETATTVTGRDMKDISGLIGQYAHGNEPSHHMAYLYNYLNQPWKTQEKVRYIMDNFYTNAPDGLIGNEDCGQMSAWFVLSAMGFYPVNPGQADYAIGSPLFPAIHIQLENGNTFTISASNLSKENKYIQSATLNGVPYPYNYLRHQTIMEGGRLHFEMGKAPNKDWGSDDAFVANTAIKAPSIVPAPIIQSAEKRIRKTAEVQISSLAPACELFYTLDGNQPDSTSKRYINPLNLSKSATIKAVAYHNKLGYSAVSEATFVMINTDHHITLKHPSHPNYNGGGDDALIDGIRGNENWRLGGWQGFQGTDLEAVIDLGKPTQVNSISMGFLQDVRSWIWMPVSVDFYISADGKQFTKKASVGHQVADNAEGIFTTQISAPIESKTRFIKVLAKNYGMIPQWHLGAGGQAYIFADEIVIN